MTTPPSPDACFRLIGWVAGVGLTLSAVQQLAARRDYRPGGLFDWHVGRLQFSRRMRATARAWSWCLGPAGFTTILVARLVGLGVFLLAAPPDVRAVGITVVGATLALASLRNQFGQDGSDQMFLVVCAALVARGWFAGKPGVDAVCLWFLACQTTLAYFAAGAAKLVSGSWRSGRAVAGVMNTRQYGGQRLAAFLTRRPRACLVLAWAVMGFEVLFPLAFVIGFPVAWAFLAAALGFHVACAVVMGLDQFVWAFASTYPAVVYAVAAVHA